MPSLKQLNEAIASYRADHPDVLMTIVVDATFGHRIDQKEVAAFEEAIDSNEFVAPPAGAVGRGDGFILNIAQKANASILSNDSYQEFHGEFTWLFDEGRLIGGKPVPHVGWVWVNRVPVRGPISRRSVKEGKSVDKQPGRRRGPKANDAAVIGSADANAPMPIPTAPPPGAVMPTSKAARDQIKGEQIKGEQSNANRGRNSRGKGDQNRGEQTRGDQSRHEQPMADVAKPGTTNDLLAFLSFVEHFPVGTAVTGVVESYSSHGAYVAIGDVHGYVPLRLMADPPPRSAREAMNLGETVTLVVSSFGAARRSIDLAVPSMAPAVVPPPVKAKRGAKAAPTPQMQVIAEALAAAPDSVASPTEAVATPETAAPRPAKAARGRSTKKPDSALAATAPAVPVHAPPAPPPESSAAPAKKVPAKKAGAKSAKAAKAAPARRGKPPTADIEVEVSPAARSRRQPRAQPVATQSPERSAESAPAVPQPAAPAAEQAPAPARGPAASKKKAAPAKKATPRRRPTSTPSGEMS